jgi:hypothetical protein
MNSTPLSPDPSPTGDHPRPLWRFLRVATLVTAFLGVVLALGYGIENYRGWREWNQERTQLLARGVPIDRAQLIPPPLPDEKNFAEIPLFRGLMEYTKAAEGLRWTHPEVFKNLTGTMFVYGVHSSVVHPEPNRHWWKAESTDLAAWQTVLRESFGKQQANPPGPRPAGTEGGAAKRPIRLPEIVPSPAQDVLAAMETFRPEFETIAAGVRERPEARFNIHYDEDYLALLPHLAVLKKSVLQFSLRASARLAAGQPQGAVEDIRTALRLSELLRGEPFLISQLVRLSCLNLSLQPLWEAQTGHQLDAASLASLQADLSRLDPSREFRLSLDYERALAIQLTERMASSLSERRRYLLLLESLAESGIPVAPPLFEAYVLVAPRGWLYASLAETSRTVSSLTDSPMTELPRLLQNLEVLRNSAPSARLLLHRILLGPVLTTGLFNDHIVQSARTMANLRLAATACALERHFLRTRQYPENLGQLVPTELDALPLDPVSAQPLRYQRENSNAFRLWSVGPDSRDDDGKLVHPAPEVPGSGDWIWRTR